MRRYSISEIRMTQKGEGFYLKFSNEMATHIVYYMQFLNIHPNYFTLLSLVFGIFFSYSLIDNHLFVAAIAVNLFYLFDNLDGQWARIKKMTSAFGAVFDSLVDGWNISIVIGSIGIYLYNQDYNSYYLYLTTLFYIFSFLDFALEKNMIIEQHKDFKNSVEAISLQNKQPKYKKIILHIASMISYDKWILMITLGCIFDILEITLLYIVCVRLLNYTVKLFKLYLKYK